MSKMLIDPVTADRQTVPDSITVRGRTISGFQELRPEDALPLQREILEAANECGCRSGTVTAALALSIYLIVTALKPILFGDPVTSRWLVGFGVVVGGSLVGKLVGLLGASQRLQRGTERFDGLLRERKRRAEAESAAS